jgi:hypothetical protein
MSFDSQVNDLYEAWGKLIAKNEPFYSSVRIDDEAINLLSPYFSDIETHKGLYITGFTIEQHRNSLPKVCFDISSSPCASHVRTAWEIPSCPVVE